jgi:mono/diheme cytochrome c family protein
MKMRLLPALAGLAIGPMSRVLSVALLTSISNAASLQSSATSEDPLDLEVITLDPQGIPAKTVYYSYDQLLTLPAVTVKTERDPNTSTPATYTGIYLSDLFEAFDADAAFDVIAAKCSDGSKQYYDRNYLVGHRPILLLKFDDKPPADWPNAEHGSWLGPYCVVHESFSPAETIHGYIEQPRIAFAVASLELTRFTQSLGRFKPKERGNDPEVVKGEKIAVGSCISCHNLGNAGGHRAGSSWEVLAERAVNSKDYFRKYVTDPHSMNVMSGMPPHPTFDDNTFNALEAYFKAMMPTE